LHHLLKGARSLDGIEVLALNVLDQRDLEHLLVCHARLDHRTDRLETRDLRSAPAAFAGDELILTVHGAHHDRLQEA